MLELTSAGLLQFIHGQVAEFSQVLDSQWWQAHFDELIKVFIIDVTLAGDNAIVVGMAASQVHPTIRNKVIFWGIAAAVVLRILFAAITQQMLAIVGLTLAGGVVLAWVCWKMYRQIVDGDHEEELAALQMSGSGSGAAAATAPLPANTMTFWAAVGQITLADLSMSIDNVLAVAGAAGESELVLIIGLGLAIILMAVAAHFIARILVSHPWIAWVGLLMILWVALDMIYRGSHEVACEALKIGCTSDLVGTIRANMGL